MLSKMVLSAANEESIPMIDNPLNLGTEYIWQAGDTMMLVALKYRRPGQWTELLDLNKIMLMNNRYMLKAGDLIQVPADWFPLPNYSFDTKLKGSHGTRQVEEA